MAKVSIFVFLFIYCTVREIDGFDFPLSSGTSIIFSQQRMQQVLSTTHQAFPPIPNTADEMISTGVIARPTFFGCFPTQNPPEFPLLLYFPNAPPLDGSDPVTKYASLIYISLYVLIKLTFL